MSVFKVLRYLTYTLEIVVFFMVGQTPGLVPQVFGATPLILLPIAFSIAMFEGPICAMSFGVFCGFLLDYGSGSFYGFHGFILAILCFFVSKMSTDLFHKNFITGFPLSLAGITIVTLYDWLFLYVIKGYGYNWYALYMHFLPSAAYTAVLIPVFYFFNRGLKYLLHEKRSE